MPHRISTTPQKQHVPETKAERARRYLSGGGVIREDSDDELGLEDYPWQWLYSHPTTNGEEITETRPKSPEQSRIIGARMGNFQCLIGDCVLLKAEGTNEAWVGLICDFQDDEEEEKAANFMWFSTEREIRNKQKKRTDALPVCAVFLLGFNMYAYFQGRMNSTLLHHGTLTL